jgi:hypothetical protein
MALRRNINLYGLFGALLLSAFIGYHSRAGQQATPPQYFPETGHTVRDPFITYFIQTGGLNQYGYPITDDYVDPSTGFLVQYFEKARLEWHPGNTQPYKVQLGLLGDEMGKRRAPIPISKIPPTNDPNCVYFAETGHSLCFMFLDYWLKNGGLDRFGYPITEFTNEGGPFVQYFQRARMEWHPEEPAGQTIQLAQFGLIYYRFAGFDLGRLSPTLAGDHPGTPTTVYARASVFKRVAVANGSQTAFVFVTDQLGRPMGGAAVTLLVHYPQREDRFSLPPTSANGTSFQAFALPTVEAGAIVSMDFIISYPGVQDSVTRTSCMIWY